MPRGVYVRTEYHKKVNSECHKGEKNNNWKGGISRYSWEFETSIRYEIKERDNFTCQECGATPTGKKLHTHHIDENKRNDDPSNLITLCEPCHKKIHTK